MNAAKPRQYARIKGTDKRRFAIVCKHVGPDFNKIMYGVTSSKRAHNLRPLSPLRDGSGNPAYVVAHTDKPMPDDVAHKWANGNAYNLSDFKTL
jgi:hypothetical protein